MFHILPYFVYSNIYRRKWVKHLPVILNLALSAIGTCFCFIYFDVRLSGRDVQTCSRYVFLVNRLFRQYKEILLSQVVLPVVKYTLTHVNTTIAAFPSFWPLQISCCELASTSGHLDIGFYFSGVNT